METTQLKGFRVNLPEWLPVLNEDNAVIAHVLDCVKRHTKGIKTVDGGNTAKVFNASPYFSALETVPSDGATGVVIYNAVPHDNLFYRVLTEITGAEIQTQGDILAYVQSAVEAKREYEKLVAGIQDMNAGGYGVVNPSFESFKLEKPTLYKNGKNFGVKLTAKGSSIHLVRVDVDCTVNPIIGEQAQSEEMVKFLQSEYETNPTTVWQTPIFGKSLESIVREEIAQKALSMPAAAKQKLQKTVTRIVNNGKGGVICILL